MLSDGIGASQFLCGCNTGAHVPRRSPWYTPPPGPPVNEQLDILELVAGRLNNADVPYMITGSIASSYYAEPRMTRDIDVVIDVRVADIERLASLFEHDFYCDREAIRRAVETRRMVNLIHSSSLVKVDLIVRKDSAYRRTEFERRQAHKVGRTTIWMATAEDLLLSKLVWAEAGDSEVQRRDAKNLADSVPTLDWPYIHRWARELSVEHLAEGLHPS